MLAIRSAIRVVRQHENKQQSMALVLLLKSSLSSSSTSSIRITNRRMLFTRTSSFTSFVTGSTIHYDDIDSLVDDVNKQQQQQYTHHRLNRPMQYYGSSYHYSTSSRINSSTTTSRRTTDSISPMKSTKKLTYDEIFETDKQDENYDDDGPVIPGQYYLEDERKQILRKQEEDVYQKRISYSSGTTPLTEREMKVQYQKLKDQLYEQYVENNKRKDKMRTEFNNHTNQYFYDEWERDEADPTVGIATYSDIPDWKPEHVSKTSAELVTIYQTPSTSIDDHELVNDITVPERYVHLKSLPTLPELSFRIQVPTNIAPDPVATAKTYALWRKREHYNNILNKVKPMVFEQYTGIIQLDSWADKQDAVDALYESIEQKMLTKESIISKHPLFHKWIVSAVEESLILIRKHYRKQAMLLEERQQGMLPSGGLTNNDDDNSVVASRNDSITPSYEEIMNIVPNPVPIFIDCYDPLTDNVATTASKTKGTGTGTTKSSSITGDRIGVPIPIDNGNYQKVCPNIVHPLAPSSNPRRDLYRGSMVEEWDLSANKETKRIMVRHCTIQLAQKLLTTLQQQKAAIENSNNNTDSTSSTTTTSTATRFLVTGRQGVGKTATLATIVASARKSGCIVLFIPDGDRLRKHGFYVEPNEKLNKAFEIKKKKDLDDQDDSDDDGDTRFTDEDESTGQYDSTKADQMRYDVPVLAQEVCIDLLHSHDTDLEKFLVTEEHMLQYFFDDQVERIKRDQNDKLIANGDGVISLKDLLAVGAEKVFFSSMCYSIAMDILTKQTKQPFVVVIDEYNVYYDPYGHYYHQSYDPTVRKCIPHEQISLFRPFLQIMSLTPDVIYDDEPIKEPALAIQYGALIVATTESHAVPRKVTDALVSNAAIAAKMNPSIAPVQIITVPKLSLLEVTHMIANYESIGVGMLRLDRGRLLSSPQEIQYMKTVSGNGIAQKLFDACMVPLGTLTTHST